MSDIKKNSKNTSEDRANYLTPESLAHNIQSNPAHYAKIKEGVKSWNAWRSENPDIRPNLSGADLRDLNLTKADFHNIDLSNATLQKVPLTYSNFQNALLHAADLGEALLWYANFEGVKLTKTNFDNADLTNAQFNSADLFGASFINANLSNTLFKNASLWQANIKNANLKFADFENTRVTAIKYNRFASFRGMRVGSSYGSPRFKRFAQDQDYIEELKNSSKWGYTKFLVWLILADCGRSLWPWIFWTFAVIISFGMLFYSMGPEAVDVGKNAVGIFDNALF